jgi:hypothetical protein
MAHASEALKGTLPGSNNGVGLISLGSNSRGAGRRMLELDFLSNFSNKADELAHCFPKHCRVRSGSDRAARLALGPLWNRNSLIADGTHGRLGAHASSAITLELKSGKSNPYRP